jgi:hypothetical protein
MRGNDITMVILRLFNQLPEKKQREIMVWKNDLPPRGWIIYFSCFKEPKTIKQMSIENGYSNFSALYHDYKGIPIIDWMLQKGYVKIARKEGRNIFYYSGDEK